MKRMIREELIQKISELDIEELASAVAKAENSLQLPSEAPASKKMVVINTSGEQEMDDIPSGGTQLYEHTLSMINGNYANTLNNIVGFEVALDGTLTFKTDLSFSFTQIKVISASSEPFLPTEDVRSKILIIATKGVEFSFTYGVGAVILPELRNTVSKIFTGNAASNIVVSSWTDAVVAL